jgi:hypothetical protein
VTRVFEIAGLFLLLAAGGLFVLCGVQWSREAAPNHGGPETLRLDRRPTLGSPRQKDGINDISPLIKQAALFAQYLSPPEPPARQGTPPPRARLQPVIRPPRTTPTFRLLSTTYYRSHPERSLALVAEPGKAGYWIRKGQPLGHLVVESIEKGTLVYRDAARLHEMTVSVKETLPWARRKSDTSAPTFGAGPDVRLVRTARPTDRGIGMPPAQPIPDQEPE